jgi:hypothetical protein
MKIAILLLCLILAGCDQLKSSSRYQLVPDSNGRVWKIDTASGEVWMCHAASFDSLEKKASIMCFPSEQLQR